MLNLSLYETRVLGVLFEKERTTPDQYPLSLNALTLGCNQKSNREPVLNLEEPLVQETVDELIKKGLATEVVVGSRVRKFRQRFGNTEFSDFKLTLQEQSLLCVLFLRGPQTPGELRTRTNRLCDFVDVGEVEQVLQALIDHAGNPYVTKLPREPGKREHRYAHLFSGDIVLSESRSANTLVQSSSQSISCELCSGRIEMLEQKVEAMQGALERMQRLWDEFNN
jgi:uncharacterized protein YceH (UPF0502 family)